MTTTSGFDGIDVADQVSNGDVRRGKFLYVTFFRREICDPSGFAALRDQIVAAAADRSIRVVVNFAPGNVRHARVEQRSESAKDAAFGLAAQSEKNEIVSRKNGIHDLGDDGVIVTDDARKN